MQIKNTIFHSISEEKCIHRLKKNKIWIQNVSIYSLWTYKNDKNNKEVTYKFFSLYTKLSWENTPSLHMKVSSEEQ